MKTVYIWGGIMVDPSQNLEQPADVVCVDGTVSQIILSPSEGVRAGNCRSARLSPR